MLLEAWGNTSVLGKLGFVVALATMGVAATYAWRPSETRLALIRPLSMASVFAALCSFTVGAAQIFDGISLSAAAGRGTNWPAVAAGTSETFAGLFVTFGCLTLTWILVAVGVRRTP